MSYLTDLDGHPEVFQPSSDQRQEEDFASHQQDAVIMMVDDEPIMVDVVQAFLEEAGYRHFISLYQSEMAFDTFRNMRPDLLLLDLKMPGVDGFEILSQIRADPNLKHSPVIVLTSASDSDTKLRALELGATDFLAKPVDPSELLLRVRNTLTVKAYQDQLAYYDSLTGLPNRKLYMDRVASAIRLARRDDEPLVVMHIGLDRFKQINESLGPEDGDRLLRSVSKRLVSCIRDHDTLARIDSEDSWRNLARLGGDEFSLLLQGVHLAESATFIARRVLDVLHEPFDLRGQEVYLSASIGIAIFPDDGHLPDLLLRNASAASHHVKDAGRDGYKFFSEELNLRARRRLSLEAHLRRSLEREELYLEYQPKVCARSGRVAGMEALLRWQHEELGRVPPDQFIPLAEETGLIVPIGEWLIYEACRQNSQWQAEGLGDLTVSVNVSSEQFCHDGLLNSVRQALAGSRLDPGLLTVELTESIIMDDAARNIDTLHQMKAQGIALSIDDFGTGYSSLSYLKLMPIDELKIDRSFLLEVPGKESDVAIVRAIIAMAKSLSMRVVAEGVENEAQLHFLQQQQCDLIQGFLFSRPLGSQAFAEFIRGRGE